MYPERSYVYARSLPIFGYPSYIPIHYYTTYKVVPSSRLCAGHEIVIGPGQER